MGESLYEYVCNNLVVELKRQTYHKMKALNTQYIYFFSFYIKIVHVNVISLIPPLFFFENVKPLFYRGQFLLGEIHFQILHRV
jgi:hypothetical protein